MGRNLSPVLQRELANLDKDAASRKSAMKALKSYVKDLDSKAIPMFLAQVSETKEAGSLSGEYTISLYEVLARVHGVNIVPQIDSIMVTIIKTLASSAGSFPLQQACSKVVPAIARYGIDPTASEDKKRHIIHSLCRPLSEALLGSQECLTSGAALCLKALVDSDNWRYASDEMVNRVCQNVAVALEEKSTQSNSHMSLVMALAKHNPLIVEAYARLLIQSGLRILDAGVVEGNSQKRLSAIQMVNFLMKCLDSRSVFSELDFIIEEMEKCQSDQMAYVSGAAFEALQTAKKIASDKVSKFQKSPASVTASNFTRRNHRSRRNTWSVDDQSSASLSPESQTLDSFTFDSLLESPISTINISCNEYDRGSANRKHWSYDNGGVDISLKDGIFSHLTRGSLCGAFSDQSEHRELTMNGEDTGEFNCFIQTSPRNGLPRSATLSPQGSGSCVNVDNNINMFTTPRKLIHSLQESIDENSDFSEKQNRRSSMVSAINNNDGYQVRENGGYMHEGDQQFQGPESVSSTDDNPVGTDVQMETKLVFGGNKASVQLQRFPIEKDSRNLCYRLVFLFIAMLVVFTSLIWIDAQDDSRHLVPT